VLRVCNPGMGSEIALSAATIPPTGLVQGTIGRGNAPWHLLPTVAYYS